MFFEWKKFRFKKFKTTIKIENSAKSKIATFCYIERGENVMNEKNARKINAFS